MDVGRDARLLVAGHGLEEVRPRDREQHRRLDRRGRRRPGHVAQQRDLAEAVPAVGLALVEHAAVLRDPERARLEDVVAVARVALADQRLAGLEGDPAGARGDGLELGGRERGQDPVEPQQRELTDRDADPAIDAAKRQPGDADRRPAARARSRRGPPAR